MTLTIELIRSAISGTAAAFRSITEYQPTGGPGSKVFPATYMERQYATEKRRIPNDPEGRKEKCVLLDSVQSQANRMELALLERHQAGEIKLPLITTRFDQEDLPRKFDVTSLDAPHRMADALFRDSMLGNAMFRESDKGKILDNADIRKATGLFSLCPTALLFGMWDSMGPKGGMGAKFQRAIVSEIIGYDAISGRGTSSRLDPAQIKKEAGSLYKRKQNDKKDSVPDWTLEELEAEVKRNKPVLFGNKDKGAPAGAGHGNIPPTVTKKMDDGGGVTISRALQTTTLSLAVLRRLRFPLDDSIESDLEVDLAARVVLAALGLAAGALARVDVDLRSRCHLFAENAPVWELLDQPGEKPNEFDLSPDASIALLNKAIEAARSVGLPWHEEGVMLTPSPALVQLVKNSQETEASSSE